MPADLAAAIALGGEMGRRFAEYDWAAHPLGPLFQWPADIRATVAVALTSRFPIVLWLGGQDLFHVYNDGYIPMLGDKHPAALGTPAQDVWWEIWPQIGPMLGGVIKTGEATWSDDLMLALVTAGRPQERYFTFSYGPIMSGDGRVGGVFCAVNETTERVLGERRMQVLTAAGNALMETRTVDEAVQATVQACGDGHPDLPFLAIYVDEDSGATRLRGASPQVMGLLPATLDRLTATPDVDDPASHIDDPGSKIQVADDLGTAVPELPSVFGEDCPERALVIALTDAGPESLGGFLVVGLNPRRPLDDQYRGFCLLLADQVSSAFATASSYEQERRRADVLAELDQAKTAFLTNVSHEFRTPLTLLVGPLDDAIADTRGESVQFERLETARRNASRLLRLVNSLLEFSRVEAGRAEASLVTVDLGALTAQIASSFAGLCERAGIELVLDCDPVTAEVDVTMWETIVLNLLSNAVKFTFDGSVTVQVSRGPSEGGRLRVVDTGSGIPQAELGRLFDRFYRASNTRGRSVEGSGIGLSLVRSLTELNDGTVRIDSTVDVGTTVTIDLPPVPEVRANAVPLAQVAKDGQPASNPYVAEAMQWLDVETADPPARSARDERPRPLVLIADDNPDMRRYLRRILSPHWDTVIFGDGRTALHGVRHHRPDLVVTDVMMPDLDGFGLVAAIRDDPGLASTPVLMLSARAGPDAAGDGYAVGADDYLTKPFTSQELVNRVEARLSAVVRQQSEELRRDSLTGLLSRRAITQEIDDLTARQGSAKNPESPNRFALTLLDLDRFRQVNNALGHPVGDRILAVVAERLTESVRSTDLVARLGGDEFAILQPHVPDARAARALGANLARSLAAPADVDGQPIDIAASTGIAMYPDHGLDATTLMRHAEVAMYEAKHRNDTTVVYAPGAEQTSATRLSLLADLRLALEDLAHRDEIAFFYQPQVEMKTGDVVAAEALLRWHHPDRGVVNVEDILQVAEHSPVMRQLTLRVVDDVVAQVAQWKAAGMTLRAAINVSARDLDTPDLVDHIGAALEWRQVRAAQLTVELTETALMDEIGPVQANLRRLADLGVEIALDDFGTGYSSLAHVRRLAVTEIKIDRSFTSRMATDHGDNAIVRSIIGLARDLGLRVVAEGVEDEDTYDMLAEAGCDIAQGWLIARPMPAEQFLEWLGERRAPSTQSSRRRPGGSGR